MRLYITALFNFNEKNTYIVILDSYTLNKSIISLNI